MPHGLFEQIDYLEAVIKKAVYFHVAFSVNDQPYVVPLNFGYHSGVFYVHSKPNGRKLEMVSHNSKVAFSLLTDVEPLHEENKAESCTMKYMSVMGEGHAALVTDTEEKIHALDIICHQYNLPTYDYGEKMMKAIAILKIIPGKMIGKWGNVDCDQYFKDNN
jgi:nitroimidazol reductase NimA-like FMN-containing flavoprotein (pyridoxamine 5'-phosphate oxidase superfamily)